MTEAHRGTKLRHPSPSPDPAAEDRIQKRSNEELTEEKRAKCDALTNGADDDVSGCFHEDDLKQHHRVAAGIVSGSAQEEPFPAQKSPLATSQQEAVQRGCTADVRGGRVHRDGAELKGVPDGEIREKRKDVRREIQHHQMCGVLLSHESTRQ